MTSVRAVPERREVEVELPDGKKVSGLLDLPVAAISLLVLAHGAGAGMRHPFLEKLSGELNSAGLATFRYQFPYMERRSRIPDPAALLIATVKAAVEKAAQWAPKLPIFAGGKSMGGRMTSTAAAERLLGDVRGLIFFGFPLHPPNRPGTKRAEHLARVRVPMFFLQGTRDTLADLTLLRPICVGLGSLAALKEFKGADHSFHVLKSSGRSDSQVMRDLADNVVSWMRGHM